LSTLFELDTPQNLAEFFARLGECRNKTEHVHGLHPYPAKFIPHIPRALIGALAKPGDVVLDPMCGSGTTLVEATTAGHPAVGVDLNPIATLVSRAKTTPLSDDAAQTVRVLARDMERTAQRLCAGDADALGISDDQLLEFHNRDKWFSRPVARELMYAKLAVSALLDSPARDVARCALSAVLVSVSNQESETRWCAKPRQVAPGSPLQRLASRLMDSLERLSAYSVLSRAPASVHTADARALPLEDSNVDVVVTSPPYANSHDYYLYNKLRMFWLDHDVREVQTGEIGSRNKHSDLKQGVGVYADAMSAVLAECRRVMRCGGPAAIVVGDSVVRGEFYDMAAVFEGIASSAGFTHEASYRFGHRQFNSTFQRGFGTREEKQTHVLIFRAA
jgi:DNA modification methylase